MGKLNKTCLVCGKNYHYCYSCPSDLQNPSWKNLFDTEECKEIFNILCKNGQGMITDDEAKELLSKYDLTQKDSFVDNIKNHIDKVFGNIVVVEETEEVIKADEEQEKEIVLNESVQELSVEAETSSVVSNEEKKVEKVQSYNPNKAYKKRHKK